MNVGISCSSSVESRVHKNFGASSISEHSFSNSEVFGRQSFTNAGIDQESYHQNMGDNNQETLTIKSCYSLTSTKSEQVNYLVLYYLNPLIDALLLIRLLIFWAG